MIKEREREWRNEIGRKLIWSPDELVSCINGCQINDPAPDYNVCLRFRKFIAERQESLR